MLLCGLRAFAHSAILDVKERRFHAIKGYNGRRKWFMN